MFPLCRSQQGVPTFISPPEGSSWVHCFDFKSLSAVQYWFDGPESSALASTQAPNELFELACSDATSGGSPRILAPASYSNG